MHSDNFFFFFFNPSFWGLMDLEIPLLRAEQESWNRQTMTIRCERPVFVFLHMSCISKLGSHFTNKLWHNLLVRFWRGEKKTVHVKELRKVGRFQSEAVGQVIVAVLYLCRTLCRGRRTSSSQSSARRWPPPGTRPSRGTSTADSQLCLHSSSPSALSA